MNFKLLLLLSLVALSCAPIGAADQRAHHRLRASPRSSPDGKRLAFVYRGDVWIADSRGGRAQPITSHLETDAYPVFSPDGNWIAFSSKRNGNWDIYVIPADGGRARQLTWHSGTDVPTG